MRIIEDDIGTVVQLMRTLNGDAAEDAPYYMFGHVAEVDQRIVAMAKSPAKYNKRFPLIVLRLPTTPERDGDMLRYSLNLAIIAATEKSLNAEERLTRVFKPTLFPLYERFFAALKRSGLFMWSGNLQRPEHTSINRYFWGTPEETLNNKKAAQRQVFSDPIDAIEIVNLIINQKETNC